MKTVCALCSKIGLTLAICIEPDGRNVLFSHPKIHMCLVLKVICTGISVSGSLACIYQVTR